MDRKMEGWMDDDGNRGVAMVVVGTGVGVRGRKEKGKRKEDVRLRMRKLVIVKRQTHSKDRRVDKILKQPQGARRNKDSKKTKSKRKQANRQYPQATSRRVRNKNSEKDQMEDEE
ncbi:hypothetical protein BOTBODRAFT_364280 [Botryobasidium botryosum FD-172 SS1]|uniref:Uncharacterized protein n=1 Tax=Botryobasidium botryosum (strain FD-172 SS1) TaxID=930990 RepID=A0A067MP35_BOTB1|nr:hypothetical protein BOTBODRAFT_364280 [Botryobasidium botryosum FD-172 SS1]